MSESLNNESNNNHKSSSKDEVESSNNEDFSLDNVKSVKKNLFGLNIIDDEKSKTDSELF